MTKTETKTAPKEILAIDPGTTESAFVVYDGKRPKRFGKIRNPDLLLALRLQDFDGAPLFIEMIASYGMAVGAEVFETCVWIGKFTEAHRGDSTAIYRKDVKLYLCGQTRAKDPNVRQALLDRFGPGKEKAIGKKSSPGPLYGVSGDVWAALAVAVTAWETRLSLKR